MNIKKATSLLLGLVLFLSLIMGCGPKEEPAASLPAGFIPAGQLLTGGQDIGDGNAKALTIEQIPKGEGEGARTRLTFSFVTGSRLSGGQTETPAAGVPTYTAYTLHNPSRLVVEFDLLAHWDYAHGLTLENPLVAGTFRQNKFGETRTSVYFQLTAPAALQVEEGEDTLTITLLPTPLAEEPQQYVTINAYDAYMEGAFSPEYNISPTLAADMTNRMLISKPFATTEEAEAFLQEGQAQYPAIPLEQWQIMELAPGELPSYRLDLTHIAAYQSPAARCEGVERPLPVLAPDGLYLCDMPEGGYLYRREMVSEGETMGEQLWCLQPDGQTRLITAFAFAAVEQAQFSPDGRKLAVLERAEDKTHLYVFDTDTYELLNDLSEMGFGSTTSAMTWNAMGNILYAITGSSGMQLHQFDYSIPDETRRHSLIDRNSIDEGGLGLFDGELYFCSGTMEEGSLIYRIKPEGGVRKPFVPGSAFAISQDSRYMAVLSSSESTASGHSLSLYDLSTGESRVVTDAFFPYDVIWSADCKTLYYIESRISGGQTEDDTSEQIEEALAATPEATADPFPYTLWAYVVETGENKAILDLCAPELYASAAPGVLYLNRLETGELGTELKAFYELDIEAFTASEEAQKGNAEN